MTNKRLQPGSGPRRSVFDRVCQRIQVSGLCLRVLDGSGGKVSERPGETISWHGLPADEAATRLAASFAEGLAEIEVASRRAAHGENRITAKPGRGPLLRFALQFVQPLVLVLLLAGVVTAILGEWVDSGVIFGVTLINAVIGFVQEGHAENALAALARSLASEVTVLRGGCKQRLASTMLVPGDIVLLAGGFIPPDDVPGLKALGVREVFTEGSRLDDVVAFVRRVAEERLPA